MHGPEKSLTYFIISRIPKSEEGYLREASYVTAFTDCY
jgi:hypothetical protein